MLTSGWHLAWCRPVGYHLGAFSPRTFETWNLIYSLKIYLISNDFSFWYYCVHQCYIKIFQRRAHEYRELSNFKVLTGYDYFEYKQNFSQKASYWYLHEIKKRLFVKFQVHKYPLIHELLSMENIIWNTISYYLKSVRV